MQLSSSTQESLFPVDGTAAVRARPAAAGTDGGKMTHTRLSESVRVYALYRQSGDSRVPHDRLRPMMFVWRRQEYRVQDVTYVWREKQGEAEIYHFTVSDGANVFELCYNARSFDWTITGAYSE
jgi:hypothetical protein